MKHALAAHPGDGVANALDDLAPGEAFACSGAGKECNLTAKERIPFGFKVALVPIPKGGDIIKYGEVIGRASRDIAPGDCVHVHNVEGKRGRGDQQGRTS